MARTYDWRSPEAAEYRRLYKSKAWRELREQIIIRDMGVCQMCDVQVVTGDRRSPRLAVVDHVTPHKGDVELFYDVTNLQLVCAACHNGAKKSEERTGFSSAVDEDGYPLDPRHPANRV